MNGQTNFVLIVVHVDKHFRTTYIINRCIISHK